MIDFQRHAAFDVGRIRTMYRPGCSFKNPNLLSKQSGHGYEKWDSIGGAYLLH